jgi:protein arginine N-methyltransferase 1
MYSLREYGAMIADTTRTDAYREALNRAIQPGAIVVDIGYGSGIFSFLACKAGAGRVYAIEANEEIAVAQEIAAANGFADRIEFIAGDSTRTTLPESADVIVSDIRGVIPHLGRGLATLIDARKRFLRPGGILIPKRDTVWGALVTSAKPYDDLVGPWSSGRYGITFEAARRVILNSIHGVKLKADDIGGSPQQWCVLDYATLESPNTCASITFEVQQPVTAYGCCFWFDTILFDEIGYTAAPNRPNSVYGEMFFPWLEPASLAAGDRACFELRANLVGDRYVWNWKTIVRDQTGKPPKASFSQSSFLGAPLAPERLHRKSAGHVPVLNEEGEMDHFLLEHMDGRASLEEIARAFAARFPSQCARWEDALSRASRIAEKYRH